VPLSIKYALLGLLADGPLHGYDLKAAYEAHLVPKGHLNYGQVYATLERLSRDGLVAHDRVPQAERPDKKVFELTAPGRRALREWLETPSSPDLDLRNEIYLKLVLARRLRGGDPRGVLAVERRACFERLHEAAQARKQAEKEGAPVQVLLLLELAALKLEAYLKWFDRCDELLREPSGER
jgi:DNA-binding PadR family transcriptional regulator